MEALHRARPTCHPRWHEQPSRSGAHWPSVRSRGLAVAEGTPSRAASRRGTGRPPVAGAGRRVRVVRQGGHPEPTRYQILKLTALTAGAVVTVLAAISAPAPLTASLAGIIVVLEGAQQMFQFHPNWIPSYRGTAETLDKAEAFLYVAESQPVRRSQDPSREVGRVPPGRHDQRERRPTPCGPVPGWMVNGRSQVSAASFAAFAAFGPAEARSSLGRRHRVVSTRLMVRSTQPPWRGTCVSSAPLVRK